LAAPAGPAQAAPKTLEALNPQEAAPSLLLPPPPPDGSDRQKSELVELRAIQDHRTDARLEQALWDDAHEDVSLFAPVLGLKFDMAALPETAKLIAIVENDQSVVAGEAKKAFHRHRPWTFDPSLVGCPRGDKPDPLTSYPSGHATLGYSLATVLAGLMPDRSTDIMARASDYAESRLVCGVHFRSDIIASQALGAAVGVMLLHSLSLQPQIEASRRELKAAGF
jgi:acid phosphatase (class A)